MLQGTKPARVCLSEWRGSRGALGSDCKQKCNLDWELDEETNRAPRRINGKAKRSSSCCENARLFGVNSPLSLDDR